MFPGYNPWSSVAEAAAGIGQSIAGTKRTEEAPYISFDAKIATSIANRTKQKFYFKIEMRRCKQKYNRSDFINCRSVQK